MTGQMDIWHFKDNSYEEEELWKEVASQTWVGPYGQWKLEQIIFTRKIVI